MCATRRVGVDRWRREPRVREQRAWGGGEEVRSAVEWAQLRAMAADGVSQREIARRLGINRRTVKRLIGAVEPPRYERTPPGSMVDRSLPAEDCARSRGLDLTMQYLAPLSDEGLSHCRGSGG